VHGAGFGVVCAVNQAPNAGMNQRSRAHGARLNCSKQLAVPQAMVADRGTRFTQRKHFRVGGGIGVGDVAIESAANDLALVHHNGAHGNFSGFKRALRGTQGFLHPEFVYLKVVVLRHEIRVRARLQACRRKSSNLAPSGAAIGFDMAEAIS